MVSLRWSKESTADTQIRVCETSCGRAILAKIVVCGVYNRAVYEIGCHHIMEQLFAFITNHPMLVGAFVILLILFIRNEMARGGATLGAQEVVNLVNHEGAIVLDVRDKAEFKAGHIVDSINIPYASLEARLDELKKYEDKPIIVACKMGQHAGAAGAQLKKAGFAQVSRLRGGITEWRGQNLPVVKG